MGSELDVPGRPTSSDVPAPASGSGWLSAALEFSQLLLSDWEDRQPPWEALTESIRQLLDADAVVVLRPRATSPITVGVALGRTMALPLNGHRGSHGVVEIRRRGDQPAFSESDLALARSLALELVAALDLSDVDAAQHRDRLREDRERIARHLNAEVVHRLSAAGLRPPRRGSRSQDASDRTRLSEVIDELDQTMREIGTVPTPDSGPPSTRTLRRIVAEVADSVGSAFGLRPQLGFGEAVDLVDDPSLADDVEAVVRDGLTSAGRHSALSHVQIHLSTGDDQLRVVIEDDGDSLGSSIRNPGLATLRRRAERRGGRLVVDRSSLGGVRLAWSVPLR